MNFFNKAYSFIYFVVYIGCSFTEKKSEDKDIEHSITTKNKFGNEKIKFIFKIKKEFFDNKKTQINKGNNNMKALNHKKIVFCFKLKNLIYILHDLIKCTIFLMNNDKNMTRIRFDNIYIDLKNNYVKKMFKKFCTEYYSSFKLFNKNLNPYLKHNNFRKRNSLAYLKYKKKRNLNFPKKISKEKLYKGNFKNAELDENIQNSNFSASLKTNKKKYAILNLKNQRNFINRRIMLMNIKKNKYQKRKNNNIKKICKIYFSILAHLHNKDELYNKNINEAIEVIREKSNAFKNQTYLEKCFVTKILKKNYGKNVIFDLIDIILDQESEEPKEKNIIPLKTLDIKKITKQNIVNNEIGFIEPMSKICTMKNPQDIRYDIKSQDIYKIEFPVKLNDKSNCEEKINDKIKGNEFVTVNKMDLNKTYDKLSNFDALFESNKEFKLTKNSLVDDKKVGKNTNTYDLQQYSANDPIEMVDKSCKKLFTNEIVNESYIKIALKEADNEIELDKTGKDKRFSEKNKYKVKNKNLFKKKSQLQDFKKSPENNKPLNLNDSRKNIKLHKFFKIDETKDTSKFEKSDSLDEHNNFLKIYESKLKHENICIENNQSIKEDEMKQISNLNRKNKIKEENKYKTYNCYEDNRNGVSLTNNNIDISDSQEEIETNIIKGIFKSVQMNECKLKNNSIIKLKANKHNIRPFLSNIKTNGSFIQIENIKYKKSYNTIPNKMNLKRSNKLFSSKIAFNTLETIVEETPEKNLNIQISSFELYKNEYHNKIQNIMLLITLFDQLAYNKNEIPFYKTQVKVLSFNNNYGDFIDFIESLKDLTKIVFFDDSGKKAIVLLKGQNIKLFFRSNEDQFVENIEIKLVLLDNHSKKTDFISDTSFFTHIYDFEACFNLIDDKLTAEEFSKNNCLKYGQFDFESTDSKNNSSKMSQYGIQDEYKHFYDKNSDSHFDKSEMKLKRDSNNVVKKKKKENIIARSLSKISQFFPKNIFKKSEDQVNEPEVLISDFGCSIAIKPEPEKTRNIENDKLLVNIENENKPIESRYTHNNNYEVKKKNTGIISLDSIDINYESKRNLITNCNSEYYSKHKKDIYTNQKDIKSNQTFITKTCKLLDEDSSSQTQIYNQRAFDDLRNKKTEYIKSQKKCKYKKK